MREDMHDVEQGKGQACRPDGTKRAHGPWATFFSGLRKAAKPIWALYAVCILALLTVCSMMGTPILNPLRPVVLSTTSLAVSNGESMLVVDRVHTRLLFVDGTMKVVEIVEPGRGVVPVDEVTDIALGKDVAYVSGLTRREDGKNVASEAVLAFDLDGTFLETVYQISYDEDAYRPIPSIVDLEADDSGVVVLRRVNLGERSRSVDLIHVGTGEPEELLRTATFDMPFYDVGYEQSSDRLLVTSFDGDVSVMDGDEVSPLLADSKVRCKGMDAFGDRVILQDASSGELLLLDGAEGKLIVGPLESVTRAKSARLSGDILCVVQHDGSLMIENLGTGDSLQVGELALSLRLRFLFARYLISLALLVVVIVIWAVRAMRGLIRKNEIGKFRRIVISILVAIIVAVATCLTSYMSYLNEQNLRKNQLLQMGSCFGYFSTEALGESVMNETQTIDDMSLSDGGLDGVTPLHIVNGLALSAHEGGSGVSCKLYVISEDAAQVYAVVSSDYDVVLGERVFDDELAGALLQVAATTNASSSEGASAAETAALSSTYVDLISGDTALGMSLSPLISRDGTCRMVAQVSSQWLTFVRSFLKNLLGKMLAFGLFAIGFYLVSDEALKLGDMLMDYRQSGGMDVMELRVRLTRPLTFLRGVVLFMDFALVAVMTRSLFLSKGVEANATLVSVPVFAAAIGLFVSDSVAKPLAKRYPMRIVTLALVVLGLVAQLVCFVSIRHNYYVWYVVGKLLTSIGYGFVITALKKLADRLQDDQDAADIGIEQAQRSSSIVAGILGGLIALIGSVWIYVASAALGAVLFWALWKTLPADLALNKNSNQQDADSGRRDTATDKVPSVPKFLRSPQMLCISLFGLIPLTIASGYKSYFLPLFLSSSSYTNTQISNYLVICNLLLYQVTKRLRSFRLASDSWLLPWTSLAAIGVLFGMFAMNQSSEWAIFAALFVSILCWLAKRCKHCARAFGVIEYNLDDEQARGAVNGMDALIENVKSLVMGAFLSLGTTKGCLALAAFMVVSSLLFAITVRPYYERMREKDEFYSLHV